ncbi:MAG: High-affinity branched-chain amino acid transport system permease protein LivH [candidate division WS2 bacterium]|nr:High-affinity branched-chain amino acid transport system permease protein LivH [Candidatus Lithacetigena glycinireducens]
MFPPWLAGGLVYASALSLTAGGITLLYITTRTFNFAHASMATFGFYITYIFYSFRGGNLYQYLPLSFLFGSLLGIICYIGLNRPLLKRQASTITLMMSTLGYDLILLSIIQMLCDYLSYTFKLYPRRVTMSAFDFEMFGTSAASIITPLIAITILTLLHLFLTRTKFGISMRASIENPILASASGINSDKVYLMSWVIGGGMAALGGAVMSLTMTGTPVMGMTVIPYMFAGAILGGLENIYGGILGGFIVGLAEYVGIYYLAVKVGPWILGYRMALPLLIMAITLLLFPRGLAGIQWSYLLESIKRARKGAKS